MRRREIAPSFFTNEDLAACSSDARLLFISLWCQGDRLGYVEDRPRRVQAAAFPYQAVDICALLDELVQRGFVARLVIDETPLLHVVNFTRWQHPHPREAASRWGSQQGQTKATPRRVRGKSKALPSRAGSSVSSVPSGPSKEQIPADAVSPAAPARRTDRLVALWQERYGQRPTWGKGDYVQLARLDKALGEPEVDRRFAAYLDDGQEFYAGHPLKLFCSQADRFAVPTSGTTPNKRGRQAGGVQPKGADDPRPDGPWAWLEPARDVSHAQAMLGMAEEQEKRLARRYGHCGWYYDCAWDAVKHWRAEVARLTPAEVR